MATTPKLRPQEDPYTVVTAVIAAVAAFVYGSTLIGPVAGWMDRLSAPPPATSVQAAAVVAAVPAPATVVEVAPAAAAPVAVAEPVSSTRPVTPLELAAAVTQLELWLEAQQRRQARVLKHVYAERNGAHAVLHLVVLSAFRAQTQEVQVAALEVIARQWALRCRDAQLVTRRQDALLLVHEEHNPSAIIGGGSMGETAGIWVKP